MELFIPGIVLNLIVSLVMYFYFCHVINRAFRWYWAALYTVLRLGTALLGSTGSIPGFVIIFAEILLLSLFALKPIKQGALKSFSVSSLIISAHSISDGIAESLMFWIVDSFGMDFIIIMKYADILRYVLTILLLILTLHSIRRILAQKVQQISRWALPVLVAPALFITLTEKIVSEHIYGSTVVWSNEAGLISPAANSPELLILRVFALISLFSAIAGFKRLITAIDNERVVFQLEQQTEYQESYLREARARYGQTISFRHDIHNHILVLGQLLGDNKTAEAKEYLSEISEIAGGFSVPVNTGSAAVDALLGSKISSCISSEIKLESNFLIPKDCGVSDIDWCIILSNALDNAITACEKVPVNMRFINLTGKRKGNFYLLSIENRCMGSTVSPEYSTGLSNITAVAEKYNGKVDIEIVDDIFIISVMIIISQQ